jgi:aminoglycoside phosphotransferase (APT) family kinase protein
VSGGVVTAASGGHALHTKRLTKWLTDALPELEPPLLFERIGDGRSNLTYRVDDSVGRQLVLRRPPLGPKLRSAHDMPREFRVMDALGRSGLSVPRVRCMCDDEAVTGAPFFVMDAVSGLVPATVDDVAELGFAERRRAGLALVDFLTELRQVDPDEVGLGDLSRRGGYAQRQIERWSRQWHASRSDGDAAVDRVEEVLRRAIPEERPDRIVHGDFKLGNVILAKDCSIAVVLDWELCTLGEPLADLATLLTYWAEPDDGPGGGAAALVPSRAPGFPDGQELVSRYISRGGESSGLAFFRTLAAWRLAIIAQGVLDRFRATPENANTDIRSVEIGRTAFASEALRLAEGL